ncbi:MAG: hypothetical protein JWO56_1011 [Acidobacteria bacterium]|nr:hypothetical protein [Acidobacteriota bacterium]
MISSKPMVARDTSREAEELQIEIHRRFTPADRLRMTIEMSEFARGLSRAGLRSRRPELSEAELDREMLRLMYDFDPEQK